MTDQTRADFEAHFQLTQRQISDQQIVDTLARHGIGWGDENGVTPYPLDGEDAPVYIGAIRELLAATDRDARDRVAVAIGLLDAPGTTFGGKRVSFAWEYLLGILADIAKDDAPVAAAAPGAVPPPELTWLFTHCRAIGMTCKSDSGKWEHDIALFTINMQNRIAELEAQLAAAAPGGDNEGGKALILPHELAHYESDSKVSTAYANGWNDCRNTMLGHLFDDPTNRPVTGAAPGAVHPDTNRLDAIAANSWKLDPFDMPGIDDADIGWRVVQYHMGQPRERTVAEVYRDDPRAAIDEAMKAE